MVKKQKRGRQKLNCKIIKRRLDPDGHERTKGFLETCNDRAKTSVFIVSEECVDESISERPNNDAMQWKGSD